ncbi:MAG: vitamin B12-dependent ribonucleotide reductase, partial [Verrucomicrobiales bacterium]
KGTHVCGDPGMQFDSTIHRWHTCKGTARQNSTNPCSEYLFLDNTACNLASLNLLKFREEDGKFNVERYRAAIRLFITAQEILVDNASYPTAEICENSHRFRTLGLGYANLGALIMSYGYGYDSEEGKDLCRLLTAILTGQAYEQSARLASIMGAFPGYHDSRASGVEKTVAPDNVESMREVITLHRKAVEEIQPREKFAYLLEDARSVWRDAVAVGERTGYRSAQVTVLAPTGTISFLMDCDTTGIEPDIALVKYKLLAGGGMLKIVNQTVSPALENLGYDEAARKKIIAHIDAHDTIEDIVDEDSGEAIASGLKPEHVAIFDCAFAPSKGTRSLPAKAHLGMMSAAQPFLSGAISKTVNLPESASVEEIMDTYIEAWRAGLKAVAIYREGSKRSAPLNTSKGQDRDDPPAAAETQRLEAQIAELEEGLAKLQVRAEEPVRRSMPDTRSSLTHKFEIAGHEGYITVGLYESGEPGEVFIQMAKEGSTIGGLMDTVATLTSMALQYGVPLESLVKKFAYQRFEPSGFTKNPDIRNATSITDYVFRWLGCRFIRGYAEAISPNRDQPDLPLGEEIEEMERRALDRPVSDLRRENDCGTPAGCGEEDPTPSQTHAERVREALGNIYIDEPCSNCHSTKVIRAGACGVCTQCGTSQGCG